VYPDALSGSYPFQGILQDSPKVVDTFSTEVSQESSSYHAQ
jgi:hypothetical protein